MQEEVPHSRQNTIRFFQQFVDQHKDFLREKSIYDLSAGSGYIANLFHTAGARVRLFDLIPGQNEYCPLPCDAIDLQKAFPISDGVADVVICAETIEHLPNQHLFFHEASRILKPDGILILTTPNPSSLRSRFSQFMMESEHYSQPAPDETTAFTPWGVSGYLSKLFVSGILRLRTLAALQQLAVKKIHPSERSSTSYVLLFLYPLLYFFSREAYRKQSRRHAAQKEVYREIFKINTSMTVLLSKHLIIEFQKKHSS